MRPLSVRVAVAAMLALAAAPPVRAQTRSTAVVAGYGSATYMATADEAFANNFSASFSPVVLYSLGPNVLFETELEFGMEGAVTETALEYAQLDYLGFDHVQIIAGKFLLPFGVFSERLHPTWINKLPTMPVLFGHAHEGVAEGSLLPVLSDAGLQLKWKQPFASEWSLDFAGYVTQGPVMGGEGEEHGGMASTLPLALSAEEGHEEGESPAPPVAFGSAFGDNNSNKMVGARLGLVKGGNFEVYASGLQAKYDPESMLDYKAGAVSVELRNGGFEFRGEGALTRQEFQHEDGDIDTLERSGLYLQAAYRSGSFEPVARWGRLNEGKIAGEMVEESRSEFALGVDYWMDTTIPLKFAWIIKEDQSDAFVVQWAFGF